MSKKGENIYQRSDGRWEGRYIVGRKENGKCRYGYIYAATYQGVKEKLTIQKSAMLILPDKPSGCKLETPKNYWHSAPETDSDSVVFHKIIAEWMSAMCHQVRESTCVKYRNMVNSYIYPELGDKKWDELKRQTIESFCQKLLTSGGKKGQGLSPKTVSDVMSVVRSIFRYASICGYRPVCDVSSILIKKEPREMHILSRYEQEKLCRFLCSNLDYRNLGILICLFTGLRIGEICALKWEDISFSEHIIYVHQTMQRIQTDGDSKQKTKISISSPKSRCSIRKIPVPEELAAILDAYREINQAFVLTGKSNHYLEPRAMERHFERILRDAGLPSVKFHALRHTFATRCVEMGFDLKSLSEILGHANVNITLNRYVHPSMDLKRENMKRLSELLAVSQNRQNAESS